MLRPARAMIARAALLSALLMSAHAAPAAALTCVHQPFLAPGDRFGPQALVAHVEVLDVRAARSMDVRVLRVLHGREDRPVLSVDIERALNWHMPRQWGFEPFSRGTRWIIVMVRPHEGRAGDWQPDLCRAFLKVEGESAAGYLSTLSTRERVTLEALAARLAPPQPPAGGPTRSR
jgi:hypothetical protein